MKKILMAFALLCAVAQGAWAEDVSYIYYTVNSDGKTITKHTDGSQAEYTVLTSSLISGNEEDRLYNGWYVLNKSFSYPERIVIYGDVKLILKDGCTLTAEQGIRINTDATLTIYAQSETEGTMGKLVATETHHDKAAIGGNKNYVAGTLFIHGGEIEAKCEDGSKYAAGIGGGYGDDSGMKGITIYGGKVTAIGAKYGAGIGGGKNNNHPGPIKIFGGDIKADGGVNGAGIGSGENRGNWPVYIYDGTVKAKGYGSSSIWHDTGGAGIGSGNDGNLTEMIQIYGGNVTAESVNGAGIGGGHYGSGNHIYIHGGTVTAKGGKQSAGIGGGDNAGCNDIQITGGTVTATGGTEGAAIGAGAGYFVGDISITGGHVTTIAYKGVSSLNGCNVGSGRGILDKYHCTLGDDMCVKPQSGLVTRGNRQNALCEPRDRVDGDWWTVEIYKCEHNLSYGCYYNGHAHFLYCKYCNYEKDEAHSYIGSNTKCTKCGYGTEADIRTLSFHQTSTASTEGYMASGTPYVQGNTIALPKCTQVPSGWEFVGWLRQNDTPSGIESADGETLLQPGDEYTVSGTENFYARYCKVFTENWQWGLGSDGDQVAVTVNNGSGPQLIYATVTSEVVAATETTPGYTVYTATATYKPNDHTYTFTDEQTVMDYPTVELGEMDNTTTLETNNGLEAKATLTGRTLYKDGKWNTLCLPFDVTLNGSPLEGATVKELSDASFDKSTGALTLTFRDATSIKAGQAYLIKWDKADGYDSASEDTRDIKAPVFTGVTLANYLCDDEISTDDSGAASVTFMGTYKKMTFDADDPTVLFLSADNKLYYPQSGASIGAQRAYFKLSGITAGNSAAAANIRTFSLDFGDETTNISLIDCPTTNLTNHTNGTGAWYTLDGRKLNGKPTQRGIYINDGKKIVIK